MKLVKVPACKFMMGVPSEAPIRDRHCEHEREVAIGNGFLAGRDGSHQITARSAMGESRSKAGEDPTHPVDRASFKLAV